MKRFTVLTAVLSIGLLAGWAFVHAPKSSTSAVPYGNALEMQYARPWLEVQNKSVLRYGNALELEYAQPWLESQNKPVVAYGNALEMQYAQPWLDVVNGSAQKQNALYCDSSLEMFYACKYGYDRP